MRALIVAEFISLDGVIQAPGGPEEDPSGGFRFGGWRVPYADEAVGQAVMDLFSRPFELLLGSKKLRRKSDSKEENDGYDPEKYDLSLVRRHRS